MIKLRVSEVINDKLLISRESARLLTDQIANLLATDCASDNCMITIDFAEVAGVAPSFCDELIRAIESVLVSVSGLASHGLIVLNPPIRLSNRIQVAARGHGMSVKALPDGSWVLTRAETKKENDT